MSGPVGISRFKVAGAALLLAAVGALTALVLAQRASHRREAAARRAELEAGPRVRVAQATGSEGPRVISLEGEALPYASTTLFAKVSGFLREIRVDKGSPVRKGQLLAVLDVPESERDLKGLLADAEDKRHAAQRMAQLGRQGIVSPQQVEDSETLARVAEEKAASQRTVMAYRRWWLPSTGW
jgi:multidrug efflux pump subunit AcrA (membrane-fusion protein)